MKKPYNSIRIFKNPILESFTHVHPIIPLVLWTPVVALLIWRAFEVYHLNFLTVASIGIVAFISWTLAEYILHRYVFHWEGKSKLAQQIHFLIHGLHHA